MLAFSILTAFQATPAEAAVSCTDSSWSVGTEADFNSAITCFNAKTGSGDYTISLTQNISLTANTTTINNTDSAIELLINGNNLIVDGDETYLPFTIAPTTTVTVQDITIQNGDGSGIYSEGDLTVDGSTLKDITSGSAIYSTGALTVTNSTLNDNQAEFGAGIYIYAGTVTIINSTLSSNSATSMGGAIFNDGLLATIQNSTIVSNSANTAGGGILSTASSMTMDNSIVANNTSENCTGTVNSNGYNFDSDGSCSFAGNGDISFQDPMLGPLQDNGGETFTHALLSHSPAINVGNSTLSEDQRGVARPSLGGDDMGAYEYVAICDTGAWAVGDEGALNNAIWCFNTASAAGSYTISLTQNISLTGSTQPISNTVSGVELTIDGNHFAVDGQDQANVRPLNIMTDTVVTLQNITIKGGNNERAGGIINSGILDIQSSTISHNTAVTDTGGIDNFGVLTITYSTIQNNTALYYGGGIHNEGTLTVLNSTINNNYALYGGGIYTSDDSDTTVQNSTLSGNGSGAGTAIYFAGDGIVQNATLFNNTGTMALFKTISSTVQIGNSIIFNPVNLYNCEGVFTSIGYNLDGSGWCGFSSTGDISGVDPMLGPLQDNGGSTFTHALQAHSPAINAGDSNFNEDQRGVARPSAGGDDIGAFEYAPSCDPAAWSVSDEISLNNAILCFNTASAAGSYTISLTQNISLTASTWPISNTISGINLIIEGSRFTVDGQNSTGIRPFEIGADTHVTMGQITVTGGDPNGQGGAIHNSGILTISQGILDGNRGGYGGAIFNNDQATITLIETTTSNNTSVNGGGMFNKGTATIMDSTLSGNNILGQGGGLYNDSSSIALIVNSTFSGNDASFSGHGIENRGIITATHVTIAENGSVGISNSGTFYASNSIVSGHSFRDCDENSGITSAGYNLDSDGSCNLPNYFDISNQDPLLGPLQDNGGATFTHALLAGSPAINAGNSTLTEDQRGFDRPRAGLPDMGAFEYVPACSADPWEASDEATLNHAILCFSTASAAGSYTISLTQNISLTTSTQPMSNPISGVELTLEGNGFTVDGQNLDDVRPFHIMADTAVTMQNMTVTGGKAGPAKIEGGGILSYGTLSITNSTITDNSANSVGSGGGISSHGPLTIQDSVIHDNSSDASGGGIYHHAPSATLTISRSTISGNSSFFGGGIQIAAGSATISHSTVSSNTATFDAGGGIQNGGETLTITNSTISGNRSGTTGGGIYNSGTATIMSSTFSDNDATNSGGGVFNQSGKSLSLSNSIISNNTAEHGGGIANYGSLNVVATTINENSATEDGGGLINLGSSLSITNSSIYSNTAVVFGGGVASNGPLTITQSTIYQNTANSGGGMYTGDSASLTNSTFSENTASVSGGAIYMTGTLTIDSGTFSGNSAQSGGAFFGTGTINLQNTLIDAGDTGTNCFSTVTITSNGHNLDSDGSCNLNGSGDISNQDPLLGPLQDNGGDTFTHALLENSPAVNAGDTALAQDQRGISRPQGDADDIGAFELVLPDPTDPNDPADPQVEPPLGSTIETIRPLFEWDDAFDEYPAVVSYTLTITQTDVVRTVEATVYTFDTTNTSLTVNVDLSAGSYLWSVQAHDVVGDVVAQTAEFSFELDVDESEPAEPAEIRVYLPIMARP